MRRTRRVLASLTACDPKDITTRLASLSLGDAGNRPCEFRMYSLVSEQSMGIGKSYSAHGSLQLLKQ